MWSLWTVRALSGESPQPVDHGWSQLPVGPVSEAGAGGAVWTGSEVLLFGAGIERDEAAAFNPENRLWRSFPKNPFGALAGHCSVWTGEQLLTWGALPDPKDDRIAGQTPQGFALDPGPGRWSELPAAPLPALLYPKAVWTGTEMMIWGGTLRIPTGTDPDGEVSADGAAYDPTTGQWRSLAPSPLRPRQAHSVIWTGREIIVWGGGSARAPDSELFADGAAYDPSTNTWRALST